MGIKEYIKTKIEERKKFKEGRDAFRNEVATEAMKIRREAFKAEALKNAVEEGKKLANEPSKFEKVIKALKEVKFDNPLPTKQTNGGKKIDIMKPTDGLWKSDIIKQDERRNNYFG